MHKRLLHILRQVMGEADVDRALTVALDALIEVCAAERGMVLLFDPQGELLFEKARNLDRRDVDHPEFEVSRTIIGEVRSVGKPYFEPDLPAQPPGNLGDSIRRLRLMSVICLPLAHDERVFGVLYLDNRDRSQPFTQETLEQAKTIAELLSLAAHRSLERHQLRNRVDSLEQELRKKYRFDAIVARDPKMLTVLKRVAQVADSEAAILIEGESGTGKELIAKAIHFNSSRRDKPFVPVNCGALPETLQESELFGHERGAFTGAVASKPGWFERAEGGTIFLDEVGEMPSPLQVKLLRVLESGEYARVGSTRIRHADVRIVAATNREMDGLVEEGVIRRDLHFRLCVVKVTLPPLRERCDDIPLLVEHFLSRQPPVGSEPWRLTPAAEAALKAYSFPGNVRELHNIVQRTVLLAEGPLIELDDLPSEVVLESSEAPMEAPIPDFKEAKRRVVEDFERRFIRRRLAESGGNITQAAKASGIDVKNFHTKMSRYGIDAAQFKAAARRGES